MKNTSSGSRIFPYGRKDKQTDMTKLTVTFRNFVNASKICLKVTSRSSVFALMSLSQFYVLPYEGKTVHFILPTQTQPNTHQTSLGKRKIYLVSVSCSRSQTHLFPVSICISIALRYACFPSELMFFSLPNTCVTCQKICFGPIKHISIFVSEFNFLFIKSPPFVNSLRFGRI